jgi:hypothetical protein
MKGREVRISQKEYKKSDAYQKGPKRRGMGFFGDDAAQTTHHEPAQFEMPVARRRVTAQQRMLGLSRPEHAAFHLVRTELFGRKEDNQAFCGQVSEMDEKDSDQFERIMDNPQKVLKIRQEILGRRKKFGIR